MAELAEVQAWMQRAIFAGGALPGFAEDVVAGDARLAAAERVAIYARGYRARLLESLRAEYPALRRLAGETAFDLFAADYIAAHPSRRPSLYDYGAGFAGHLADRAPAEARMPGSPLAIPAQLARLERARAEAARARAETAQALPVAGDVVFLPGARLRLPATAHLLRLDFEFGPLIDAVERDEPAPVPAAAETLVAVTRVGWRVCMRALEGWQFAFLDGLAAQDGDVQAAAARTSAAVGLDALAAWLPLAARDGLLARV